MFLEELLKIQYLFIFILFQGSFTIHILVCSKNVSTVKSCVESGMKTRYRKCVIILRIFQMFLF